MGEPSRLFSMDVHKLFRAFIPGLISVIAFLPFYWAVQEKITLDFIEEGYQVFIILMFAYILGV